MHTCVHVGIPYIMHATLPTQIPTQSCMHACIMHACHARMHAFPCMHSPNYDIPNNHMQHMHTHACTPKQMSHMPSLTWQSHSNPELQWSVNVTVIWHSPSVEVQAMKHRRYCSNHQIPGCTAFAKFSQFRNFFPQIKSSNSLRFILGGKGFVNMSANRVSSTVVKSPKIAKNV